MMNYCMECGTKLEERPLEGEGIIPFCPKCEKFCFPVFSTACSMVVMNKAMDKILLIKQYGRDSYILVAGYVNKGEDAENTVRREVMEETGLKVTSLSFNKSRYFEKSNTLMLNWLAVVEDEDLSGVTREVDYACWFPIEEARKNIRPQSLAQEFLEYCYATKLKK